MSFRLDPELPLADALRRAALAETDRALAALQRGNPRGIHEMRKSCKRLRAWARLLREAGAEAGATAKHVEGLLRMAARTLGRQREAAVAVETFRSLQRPASANAASWRGVVQELREIAGRETRVAPASLRRATRSLESARQQIERLPLQDLRPRDLRKALRRSARRASKRFRAAEEGSAVELHDWRKASKQLACQQELLRPRLDRLLPARRLDSLNELLGSHHDLHVLKLRLAREGLLTPALGEALARQSSQLEKRVRSGGSRLFG